jgi:hypothetical protein
MYFYVGISLQVRSFDLICAGATHFYTGAFFAGALPLLASASSGTLRLRRLGIAEAACANFRYFWKSRSLLNIYTWTLFTTSSAIASMKAIDLPEQPPFPHAESSS